VETVEDMKDTSLGDVTFALDILCVLKTVSVHNGGVNFGARVVAASSKSDYKSLRNIICYGPHSNTVLVKETHKLDAHQNAPHPTVASSSRGILQSFEVFSELPQKFDKGREGVGATAQWIEACTGSVQESYPDQPVARRNHTWQY
jgi:hypothetical protein